MPFLVKADLETHLYPEIMNEITRDDDTIITRGLNAGIAEVKSYLSRYDLLALFGTSSVDPTVDAQYLDHLKQVTKDVAAWHIIKLSNPNVDLKLFRTGYEDAIAWLKLVQKGQADPEGWPYKADDPNTPVDESSGVQWTSNKKNTQRF